MASQIDPTSENRKRQNYKVRSMVKTGIYLSLPILLAIVTYVMSGPMGIKVVNRRLAGSRLSSQQHGLSEQGHQRRCEEIHQSHDQCAFLRKYCQHDEVGLVSYLSLYFCDLAKVKPLALLIITAWLGILFASIGISASDFLCINLATIANMLGMSETLAGVTFLAFGNGSPDVFSTWTAFSTHNGSLAVGELIGAAGFITTVIAGSMAIVQPFRVSKKSFIRDATFFTVAAAFSMVFLIDGHLSLWESAIMVAFYLLYALIVILWHSMAHRRKKRKAQQARAREHFEVPRDGPLINFSRASLIYSPGEMETMHVRGPDSYLEGLDQETQFEVETPRNNDSSGNGNDDDDDDDDDDGERRERFLLEMGQQIRRTHRRTLSRMATSNQPIRPSLLGALEFSSLLASLEHNGNQGEPQIPIRRHSEHCSTVLTTNSQQVSAQYGNSHPQTSHGLNEQESAEIQGLLISPDVTGGRARSASASALDTFNQRKPAGNNMLIPPTAYQPSRLNQPSSGQHRTTPTNSGSASPVPAIVINDRTAWQPEVSISPAGSTIRPFPAYYDESLQPIDSPIAETLPSEIAPKWYLPQINARKCSLGGIIMPSWSEVRRTLLPSFEDWKEQTLITKFVSIATAPTIFLLTITVPVVHVDQKNQRSGSATSNQSSNNHVNSRVDSNASRRNLPYHDSLSTISDLRNGTRSPHNIFTGDLNDSYPALNEATTDEVQGTAPDDGLYISWKPWLVSVQIFTSPLFLLSSFFTDDASHLGQTLLWIGLYFIASLLIFLLFASIIRPGKAPAWQNVFAFPGFCVSIAWVSLIAGEVVGVLKTIGVITKISDAILGLTVFAVGNSLSDLLADLAIARLGYPVMALSACFGGPMLNILLGIGLGGMSLTIKKGHKHAHGGTPSLTTHFGIEIGRSLVISGASLLLTLIGLLVAIPLNGWMMDKKIGVGLISLWTATTIVNVILEIAMS